jgi:quinol monooxygenase YgiN
MESGGAGSVIVAGHLQLHPRDRDAWVRAHDDTVRRARAQAGCIDLALSADPVDRDRVNLFEHWESEAHLEAWRTIADPPPKPEILSATIQKHTISASGPPF